LILGLIVIYSDYRTELLAQVAAIIAEMDPGWPLRVAIDGVDGAGKTTFADELVGPIKRQGRPVIRASVDSFHNPRAIRYFRGRDSSEGYFRDSFNYDALIENLLEPLGPNGSRLYRCAAFDYRTDSPVMAPMLRSRDNAVLLLDGIFLLRPELRAYWDLTIFLDVSFEVSAERTAKRDGNSSPDPNAPENRRYVEGQKLYLSECTPKAAADLVVDNNDLRRPILSFRD
jgi:uridine kinase